MGDPEIDADVLLRRAERAVHGELPEESVLLDVEGNVAYRLNATGAALWGELERPADLGSLAQSLVERYGIPPEQALGDARRFAAALADRGLIEIETTG